MSTVTAHVAYQVPEAVPRSEAATAAVTALRGDLNDLPYRLRAIDSSIEDEMRVVELRLTTRDQFRDDLEVLLGVGIGGLQDVVTRGEA